MQKVIVDGKPELCFVLAEGTVNKIVIPLESLLNIDYHRLLPLEKKGGNMLKLMLNTRLENGVNCLHMYKELIRVIPIVKSVASEKVSAVTADGVTIDVPLPKKRGPKPKVKVEVAAPVSHDDDD